MAATGGSDSRRRASGIQNGYLQCSGFFRKVPEKGKEEEKPMLMGEDKNGRCRFTMEDRREGWYGVRVTDECPRKVRVHGIPMVPYTRCMDCPHKKVADKN